jgi:hypothetical protein
VNQSDKLFCLLDCGSRSHNAHVFLHDKLEMAVVRNPDASDVKGLTRYGFDFPHANIFLLENLSAGFSKQKPARIIKNS